MSCYELQVGVTCHEPQVGVTCLELQVDHSCLCLVILLLFLCSSFIGDCSLPKACATFVQEYGEAIINKNLFHNFLLHVVNLFDFGLVRPDTVTRTMMQLYWLQHRLATQPMVKSDTKLQVSGTTEPLICSDSS